jgi:GAF domain-containing protein
VHPFSDRQIALLQTFADQAVIAIENTRLFEAEQASKRELQESLEYQTATSDVLNVISRSPTDVQPVFDTIAQGAAQLCQAQFCHVFRFDGRLIHFAASHGQPQESVENMQRIYPIPPGRVSAAARSILNRAVESIPDIQADPEYEHGATANYRSIVAVPMLKDGRALGAICMARSAIGQFPERQIELLRTFADQAVIAIENTRLFEAEQASKRELMERSRELKESLEYQTASSKVLSVISRSRNELQPVLNSIVETATVLCEAEYAWVLNLKQDGLLHLVASENANSDFVRWIRDHPMEVAPGSAGGRAVLKRRTIHIPDVLEDPEYTRWEPQRRWHFRAMLAVPLLREGAPIGVIVLMRNRVDTFH